MELVGQKTAEEMAEMILPKSLEEMERELIQKHIEFHRGNKAKAARTLGVTVKTLYNKLHAYGMFIRYRKDMEI